MPAMIRKNGRGMEIAYNLIGKPENLKSRKDYPKKRDKSFYEDAKYSNVLTEI